MQVKTLAASALQSARMTARRFPDSPAHPERTCWGCDRYCSAKAMLCGNGSVRTPHPAELFGDDWRAWGPEAASDTPPEPAAPARPVVPILPPR